MPRAVFIKGCGRMACSSYAEVAAAMDCAYAVGAGQPLPVDRLFAALVPEASREPPSPNDIPPAPAPSPACEPG